MGVTLRAMGYSGGKREVGGGNSRGSGVMGRGNAGNVYFEGSRSISLLDLLSNCESGQIWNVSLEKSRSISPLDLLSNH
ncbi:hypothetical protein Ancab_018913 [Ancistrocladus abbreviatus]